MEENSIRWLALREAARRILIEQELTISVPSILMDKWQRLLLNMADSMPQRLKFPTVCEGPFSVTKGHDEILHISAIKPVTTDSLWLPYNKNEIIQDLIQMCSELLLAGYPGCSGCGYRDEEQEWDELAHRQRLEISEE